MDINELFQKDEQIRRYQDACDIDIYEGLKLIYTERGGFNFGEKVTQLAHALQFSLCYRHPEEKIAALLHDIGLLIPSVPDDVVDDWLGDHREAREIDLYHGLIGEYFLRQYFKFPIPDLARLHVEAKVFLCNNDGAYSDKLSNASSIGLGVQSCMDVKNFESNPLFRVAVAFRFSDDLAKVPDKQTPSLEDELNFIHSGILVTKHRRIFV
ncbi:MAG: hypothetical protein AABW49_00120 [Nanoarchaeota archaeon]